MKTVSISIPLKYHSIAVRCIEALMPKNSVWTFEKSNLIFTLPTGCDGDLANFAFSLGTLMSESLQNS